MARTVSFTALLVAIAIGAYLFAFQAKREEAATQRPAAQAEQQASAALGASNFAGAVTELEAYRASNGSYAGAALPASSGVVVVRADATSYCVQTGSGPSLQHQLGPGGSPQPGAC